MQHVKPNKMFYLNIRICILSIRSLGPKNQFWANCDQKTYQVSLEPFSKYSQIKPHFMQNDKTNQTNLSKLFGCCKMLLTCSSVKPLIIVIGETISLEFLSNKSPYYFFINNFAEPCSMTIWLQNCALFFFKKMCNSYIRV